MYREQLLPSCNAFEAHFSCFHWRAISSQFDGSMVAAKSYPPLSICHRQFDNIITVFLPGIESAFVCIIKWHTYIHVPIIITLYVLFFSSLPRAHGTRTHTTERLGDSHPRAWERCPRLVRLCQPGQTGCLLPQRCQGKYTLKCCSSPPYLMHI